MSPLLAAFLICLGAAILEAVCAGTQVKAFFQTLRFPRFSAPLWLWSIIGAAYYIVFGGVLYRLFRLDPDIDLRNVTIVLVVAMMVGNGLSNYVIFRTRDLRRAFLVGALFPFLDLTLFVALLHLDGLASIMLVPYLIYRVYAVYWGYALWKANTS